MLANISRLTLGVALGFAPSCALDGGDTSDDPADTTAADVTSAAGGEEVSSISVCNSGPIRCLAHVQTVGTGTNRRISSHAGAPIGFGAPDLQAAYHIDPSRLADGVKPTVAIVDAYGYTKLESDLAVYRAQYGLPPCTTANGCLKIVNQLGQTAPLPPNPPVDDDWTVETALDVDMASAACPLCNILVVQAQDNAGDGLFVAQNAAAALGATVISDSWGGPEQPKATLVMLEPYFDHPNIAIFVAAGDAGYNNTIVPAGATTGPDYPGTSAHVIAVGATRLVRDTTTPRGWREAAWAVTLDPQTAAPDPTRGAGGSACSLSIPKPAYQAASPCAFKATTDIAAVGDPATGVAVYNTNGTNPGWISVGGTSASAPFVAAIFAATGHGTQTSGGFIASSASKLFDVTSGTNGSCGAQTLLCNAAAGWDGPTGFGTPNAGAFMPAAAGGGPGNDGADPSGAPADDGTEITGGCSTAGGSGAGVILGLALLGLRRRRVA